MYKTILCYGDSNTWGFVPQKLSSAVMNIERYTKNERWPGVLQRLLGEQYYIIEEGLNGRTTNLDYEIPPDRNGKSYLAPCLYSHAPIDLVILALGGNDLKAYFKRSAVEIGEAIEELIEMIQLSKYGRQLECSPEVLVISQCIPLPIGEQLVDQNGVLVFEGAIERANDLVGLYSSLARKNCCHFLDITQEIMPSKVDGLHLDRENHMKLALLIKNKIEEIYSKDSI